jgi:pimeloyl-ACP methyl ester carboxylesterase
LLWGEDDRLVPTGPYAARWAELLPHAQTVIVPGAAHMAPLERPAEIATHIAAFLHA